MTAEGYLPHELPAAVSDTDTVHCQLFGHRWVDGSDTCTHRCGTPRPTPHTTRTPPLGLRDDRGAVQLVSPFLFFTVLMSLLVLAFIAGETRRCAHLEATADPQFARYCTTEVLR